MCAVKQESGNYTTYDICSSAQKLAWMLQDPKGLTLLQKWIVWELVVAGQAKELPAADAAEQKQQQTAYHR